MKKFRLTIEEREKIYYYLALKKTYLKIGQLLDRSHTTISREVKKNSRKGEYSPSRAESCNSWRYKRCGRRRKIDQNIELFEEVFQNIFKKWSPKQISGYLKEKYNGNLQMQISHESIYQYIYVKAKGELKKQLLKYLRQKGRKNKNRKLCHEKKRQIPDLISISQRPEEVEERQVPGHWEGDLVMGKNHKTAIGVLVERTTRYVLWYH